MRKLAPLGLLLALAGCSDTQPGSGTSGSGGSSTGSGGTSASGSGGSGTGGAAPAGGAGGSSGGVGGTSGGAGGSTGGVASGGGGSGGTAGTGGASGGSAGTGGGQGTPGCGSTTPQQSGTFTIDVDGSEREYILALPDDYDPNHPYILIFAWHWRTGTAQDVADGPFGDYYGLEELANGSAIFVSPEGLVDNGVTGWANPGGRDIEFLDAMLDRFRAELCIDESRIFSTGFSYGGMMSFAVGCARGDVFRAIAPMAGAMYSGCENGTAPVAMWGSHGYAGAEPDGVVPLADGRSARDEFLERNGCGTDTMPVEPDECVAYQGCQAGYPVTWCEWNGGHTVPSFAGAAIWDFFSQF